MGTDANSKLWLWTWRILINHGVSSSLVQKVKIETQEFLNLPMEEKKKYWQKAGDIEGFGQAFVVSEEQKLDWADMFFVTSLPLHLRKPHLIPTLPLPFRLVSTSLIYLFFKCRETLDAYSLKLNDLAIIILNQMGKALRIEDDYMKQLFEEGRQGIRLNYYPPCPQPELAIGINPHSDGGGLTILLQLNEMDGLQIRKNEMWVPVKPLPGAFIINIGDVLEIVTNGAYPSIEHRATVNSTKERLSIATLYGPNTNRDMGPAPSLITPENPALFKRISVADYYNGYFSRELQGKSYLDGLRIKNEDKSG
ncbi:protein SRG1-like [Pistacia vera]|uniref:protein SRG1-like n=1 Tax=Pistacia vera TaxID=55513 RepID=UPI001263079A|nr:protein SRG1-like [Pistacia vera]